MQLAGGAFTTLPGLLQRTLEATSNSAACNWREAGYWRRLSTEEFAGLVRRFALGLHDLGIGHGDCVGILAPSSPWWLVADCAALSIGAVTVPMFPNLSPEHLEFELENTACKALVVIGAAQWALARSCARRVHAVVVKGVHADRGHAHDWQAVLERGDALAARDPRRLAVLRDAVRPADRATIIHTSGSTGRPKGVVLTHANLVSQVHGATACFPLDPARDRVLSCLPLAHVFERMVMYYYLASGVGVFFCDDVRGVGALLREVKPTVITMVPRLLERLHQKVNADVETAGRLARSIGHWALDRADQHLPDAPRAWQDGVADALVYKKVRNALGGNLRLCIVGGAPLATDLHRFLLNVGLPVFVGYGLTEASPVLAVNRPGAARLGTVGKPFPGVEVRIGANDEVLARGPGIMQGYHRDAAATDAAIDADGWLHTGDRGRFDADGFLVITGRIKELFKTSGGKYVSPVPIEQALGTHPLIDQALVVAEGRRCVTALLFANPDALAKAKGAAAGDDAAWLATPTVQAELAAHVARVNAGLDQWEQVRRWRILPRPPSIEDGGLTPTLKLRRHVVERQYAALIAELYAQSEESQPAHAPAVG